MEKPMFRLIALKDATEFMDSIPDDVREKMLYNIRKVRFGVKDIRIFKKLDDHIWEFRTLWQGMTYRLFAFWDKDSDTLVIATHGIVKKKQKTPKKEIDKANAIRKEYFKNNQ